MVFALIRRSRAAMRREARGGPIRKVKGGSSDWLVGWSVGWMVGWLVGSLVRSFVRWMVSCCWSSGWVGLVPLPERGHLRFATSAELCLELSL